MKTYKITDKEVINLELQRVTITPLTYTYKVKKILLGKNLL